MADYIGEKCIVCNNKFKEGDDIVVCPDCGTPYHRECYIKEGQCINTELHKTGGSYKLSSVSYAGDDEKIRCPRCGAFNEPLTLFCEKCGMPLSASEQDPQHILRKNQNIDNSQEDPSFFGNPFNTQTFHVNFSDPLCGLNTEEDFDGVKLEEVAEFVGPNTFYYLPMFKRMKDTGHKLTWNFSAMLFPTYYFAYRKMFLFMILSALLRILIGLPSAIVMLSTDTFGLSILTNFASLFDIKSGYFEFVYNAASFLNYAFMFVAGAFSNWFYYKHVINKIKKIKASDKAAKEIIKAKGGVSKLAVILIPSILVFISIILGFISILTSF